MWNNQKPFEEVVIPKSDETKERIRHRLQSCFIPLFSGLSDEDINVIIRAMREIHVKQFEKVI